MAKYPVPGGVKTRLAKAIGVACATALYRAFVLDLADRLRATRVPVVWAFWPAAAPFGELLPGSVCRPQAGADLGERMRHAVERELQGGARRVVLIGADVPHVPLASLADACAALAAGADLVLGPAQDGGYYLIGMGAVHAALFDGIAWGTDAVCRQTVERARQVGLRTRVLAPTFDVDGPDDLARLRAEMEAGSIVLPHTAAVLARCGTLTP